MAAFVLVVERELRGVLAAPKADNIPHKRQRSALGLVATNELTGW
jgi:hypothetical protein